jgi:hypothetical protein
MTASKKKILEMLAQGRISADDAYKLLNAVDEEAGGKANETREARSEDTANTGRAFTTVEAVAQKLKPKYLRVTVTPKEGADPEHADRVNVRVPMSLVRAGLKMTALIPPDALNKANDALHDKGINFDVKNIKPEDLEELITALGDMEVDVETGHGEKVKVFVEY